MDDMIERTTHLKIGVKNVPPPAADLTLNSGVCSIFKFKIKKGSVAYRYDLEIYQRNFRESDPAKQQRHLTRGFDDGLRNLNRIICFTLIEKLINMSEFKKISPSPDALKYVYDSGKNIFFNQDLKNLDGKVFVVDTKDLDEKHQSYLKNGDVEVVFNKSASYVLKLDDTESALCTSDALRPDRSLRTVLELLTTQGLLSEGRNLYDTIGIGKVYRKQLSKESVDVLRGRRLPSGVFVREGFQKGVRLVDPSNPTPAIVIDAKASAFYSTVTLDSLFTNLKQDCTALTKLYKGVRVCLTYDYSETILISRFSPTPVKDMKIKIKSDKADSEITLLEFYKRKDISIKRPNLPVVIADGRNRRAYAPELLYVLPLQRVPIQSMEQDISDPLGKVNLVSPVARYKLIMQSFAEIKSLSASYLNAFGVDLLDDNKVQIGHRIKPTSVFNNNKFVLQRNIERWAVYYIGAKNTQNVRMFLRNLMETAKKYGMVIQSPTEVMSFESFDDADVYFLKNLMEKKLHFILFLSDKNEDIHNWLKMTEMRFRVLTQHVLLKSIGAGRTTMGNIVFKLNMKNAGLNYVPRFERNHVLDLSNGNILVISYDVSHPGKSLDRHELWKVRQVLPQCDALEPSVVGYCANTTPNPNGFSGSYFFQEPRREAVDPAMLEQKAEEVMNMFCHERKRFPDVVFVIRDGVSEGQFEMAANEECIALKKGCANAVRKMKGDVQRTRFVFTIVNKRHSKRFFARDQMGISNTRPVSIIDRGVVRADAHEFFLQSYVNNKGTVKMPQYVTIINEANFSPKELQEFFTLLCHSHQIIVSAIALPAPVHLANELAKRGSNNFLTCRKRLPDVMGRFKLDIGVYDFQKLNENFTYNSANCLRNQRFTA